MAINLKDLKPGDLIFTVSNQDTRSSGHVAMIYKTHLKPRHIRIIHATDCPDYFSVCITKLNPTSKIEKYGNHYEVVRCVNQELLQVSLYLINLWVKFHPKFDNKKLEKMHDFDHKRSSEADKISENNKIFNTEEYRNKIRNYFEARHFSPYLPENSEGFFCSSLFILLFQLASINNDSILLYRELHLDCDYTSPSTLLNSLLSNENNFRRLGELKIHYERDKIEDAMIVSEREVYKDRAKNTLVLFHQKLDQQLELPENLKFQITGISQIEADLVRKTISRKMISCASL